MGTLPHERGGPAGYQRQQLFVIDLSERILDGTRLDRDKCRLRRRHNYDTAGPGYDNHRRCQRLRTDDVQRGSHRFDRRTRQARVPDRQGNRGEDSGNGKCATRLSQAAPAPRGAQRVAQQRAFEIRRCGFGEDVIQQSEFLRFRFHDSIARG